eukprot:jgi/Mesvir1/15770/Mv03339-RA.1
MAPAPLPKNGRVPSAPPVKTKIVVPARPSSVRAEFRDLQNIVNAPGTMPDAHCVERGDGTEDTVAPQPIRLKDLCPEDKRKVAKLIQQVVEAGQENEGLRQELDELSVQWAHEREEVSVQREREREAARVESKQMAAGMEKEREEAAKQLEEERAAGAARLDKLRKQNGEIIAEIANILSCLLVRIAFVMIRSYQLKMKELQPQGTTATPADATLASSSDNRLTGTEERDVTIASGTTTTPTGASGHSDVREAFIAALGPTDTQAGAPSTDVNQAKARLFVAQTKNVTAAPALEGGGGGTTTLTATDNGNKGDRHHQHHQHHQQQRSEPVAHPLHDEGNLFAVTGESGHPQDGAVIEEYELLEVHGDDASWDEHIATLALESATEAPAPVTKATRGRAYAATEALAHATEGTRTRSTAPGMARGSTTTTIEALGPITKAATAESTSSIQPSHAINAFSGRCKPGLAGMAPPRQSVSDRKDRKLRFHHHSPPPLAANAPPVTADHPPSTATTARSDAPPSYGIRTRCPYWNRRRPGATIIRHGRGVKHAGWCEDDGSHRGWEERQEGGTAERSRGNQCQRHRLHLALCRLLVALCLPRFPRRCSGLGLAHRRPSSRMEMLASGSLLRSRPHPHHYHRHLLSPILTQRCHGLEGHWEGAAAAARAADRSAAVPAQSTRGKEATPMAERNNRGDSKGAAAMHPVLSGRAKGYSTAAGHPAEYRESDSSVLGWVGKDNPVGWAGKGHPPSAPSHWAGDLLTVDGDEVDDARIQHCPNPALMVGGGREYAGGGEVSDAPMAGRDMVGSSQGSVDVDELDDAPDVVARDNRSPGRAASHGESKRGGKSYSDHAEDEEDGHPRGQGDILEEDDETGPRGATSYLDVERGARAYSDELLFRAYSDGEEGGDRGSWQELSFARHLARVADGLEALEAFHRSGVKALCDQEPPLHDPQAVQHEGLAARRSGCEPDERQIWQREQGQIVPHESELAHLESKQPRRSIGGLHQARKRSAPSRAWVPTPSLHAHATLVIESCYDASLLDIIREMEGGGHDDEVVRGGYDEDELRIVSGTIERDTSAPHFCGIVAPPLDPPAKSENEPPRNAASRRHWASQPASRQATGATNKASGEPGERKATGNASLPGERSRHSGGTNASGKPSTKIVPRALPRWFEDVQYEENDIYGLVEDVELAKY